MRQWAIVDHRQQSFPADASIGHRARIARTASVAFIVIVVAALTATAHAQSPAISQRQEILGSFGKAVKEPGAMLRQEAPFDMAVVQSSLKTIAEGSPKLKALFPDDSKAGAYTEALPIIWEKKAEFLQLIDALAVAAKSASANIKDEATFRTEWGKVSTNCRACHKVYRTLPKS